MRIMQVTGNLVVIALLAGVLLVIAELIWYRIPGRKEKRNGAGRGKEKRVAVITGATSGLGREYAVRIDKKLPGIDEIWLIARRENRLKETAAILRHEARCLPYDLTDPGFAEKLEKLFVQENVRVRYLINCAGYARIGPVTDMAMQDQAGMIDLNCTAAVRLVDVCLPCMGRGDHIVNVCSTAAFQPFPKLNVYAATKAFLLRYTRALRQELLPKKIQVTAVCPYWIKDTEFIGIAETDGKAGIRSYPLASKVSSVAAVSLAGIRMGLPVVTPGIVCTAHRLFSKLFPDTVLQYIWEGIRRA